VTFSKPGRVAAIQWLWKSSLKICSHRPFSKC